MFFSVKNGQSPVEKTLKSNPINKSYPMLEVLCDIARSKKAEILANEEKVLARVKANPLFDKVEIKMLNPFGPYAFPYASPRLKSDDLDPYDLTMLPFNKMVNKIYKDAQKRRSLELKLDEEQELLIRTHYQYSRINSLVNLNAAYCNLDMNAFLHISHLSYRCGQKNEDINRGTDWFENGAQLYPDLAPQELFPHATLKKTVKISLQDKRKRREKIAKDRAKFITLSELKTYFSQFPESRQIMHFSMLLGHITTIDYPEFSGYRVLPKTQGHELGFILVSPDGNNKFYVKTVDNPESILLCSEALIHLGVKIPEAKLKRDEYGNQLYLTLDASRKYKKDDGTLKTKKFLTIYEARWDYFNRVPGKSTTSIKEKISFAKMILVAAAFGLSDLFNTDDNIGLVEAKKGEKNYKKFEIIDLMFEPIDITPEKMSLERDPLTFITNKVLIGAKDKYKEFFNSLTQGDILTAAKELAMPKQREYSKDGKFLIVKGAGPTTARDVIQRAYNNVTGDLPASAETKTQLDTLELQKNIMIRNLDLLTNAVIKKLSPTPTASGCTLFSGEPKKEAAHQPSNPGKLMHSIEHITSNQTVENEIEREIRESIKLPNSPEFKIIANFDSSRNSYVVTIFSSEEKSGAIFTSLMRLNHEKNLDAILGRKKEESFIILTVETILAFCEKLSDPTRKTLTELLPSSSAGHYSRFS